MDQTRRENGGLIWGKLLDATYKLSRIQASPGDDLSREIQAWSNFNNDVAAKKQKMRWEALSL
jgi:hypothetical protein